MDIELPDLNSSNNTDDKRKPLILGVWDALKEGGSVDVGNTQFKLNRKSAQALTQIGGAALEMVVNGHMEASAKVRVPVMDGNVEAEAVRDIEGRHSFGLHSSTPVFGGDIDINANRDAAGNRRLGIQFKKTF